ncbi:MAG: hypothetical protein AB7N76_18725 [Planctomycetota bacterium]
MRRTLAVGSLFGLLALALAGCGGGGGGGSSASTVAAATTATATPTPVTSSTGSATTSAAPVTTTTLARGSFRLLTYNVAGLPQGISSSDPVTNIPQISPKLNDYDLALCQEDFWYHDFLKQNALHPHQSSPLRGYSTLVGDGLNRFSAYPFSGHTRVKWGSCNGFTGAANDCLSSKGFSFAIHELAPGVELHVYNLHADAGGSAGDIQARVDNFQQVAHWILSFSQNAAVLVAGDTNLDDGSVRPRDGQTLDDFLAATGCTEVARLLGKPSIIDRVMFRSSPQLELTPVRWRIADEFITAAGAPLSDHEAVNVDFTWEQHP